MTDVFSRRENKRKPLKIMSAFFALMMFITVLAPVTYAAGLNVRINEKTHQLRLKEVLQKQIESVEDGQDLKVCLIKELTDFAGNSYTLAEYSPVGYAIMSEDSGIFLETSAESISPYYGYGEPFIMAGRHSIIMRIRITN